MRRAWTSSFSHSRRAVLTIACILLATHQALLSSARASFIDRELFIKFSPQPFSPLRCVGPSSGGVVLSTSRNNTHTHTNVTIFASPTTVASCVIWHYSSPFTLFATPFSPLYCRYSFSSPCRGVWPLRALRSLQPSTCSRIFCLCCVYGIISGSSRRQVLVFGDLFQPFLLVASSSVPLQFRQTGRVLSSAVG